ncbi:DUF4858 domain-containing protein [Phocaeicola barnesiae]
MPFILCSASILPAAAQQGQDQELKLNEDAIKMIQFDFTRPTEEIAKPLESPLEKKWMEFRTDIKMPRSLTDTTTVKKIIGYIRAEPYTIWTKFGEDPVYDVLVTGRPKEWKIYWTLNPFGPKPEEYGRSMPVMPRANYARMVAPIGPSASISGDINGFLYDVLSPRGRMLAHNRKHANAWKTYKDYQPTKEDSLKFPTYIRHEKDKVETVAEPVLATRFAGDQTLPIYQHSVEENDSLTQVLMDSLKAETAQRKDSTEAPKPQSGDNVADWYDEMRQQKVQDSLRRLEFFRRDKTYRNQYDVEKEQRRFKEKQN